ncbi:dioxygenase family protein [Neolewinella persica]|uniref:dioxygenase family protein n=1 Tax=Neolewinella persica TaxID=70998 RepID=UPI000363DE3B|nr:hypothetical protein [Neolewinella persica]
MNRTSIIYLLPLGICFVLASCSGQTSPVKASNSSADRVVIGGPFENSEYGMIDQPATIMSVDTSPGWNQPGQKLLITGTMYQNDGKTPAAGVVLYYYHTNVAGRYQASPSLNPQVSRHGYIRGWVKSDEQGKYAIYTVRPGAYPGTDEPAHIHPSIYEPGLEQPYYLDEFVFDDDPLLTSAKRRRMLNRGGSGVLRTVRQGDLEVARHDVILGLNIPAYPSGQERSSISGPAIGEDLFSFRPYHAWGPDENTRTCPICKYGKGYGVLCFVGPNHNPKELTDWLRYFESIGRFRPEMNVFFIFSGQPSGRLRQLGQQLNLHSVALTSVPGFRDTNSEIHHYALDSQLAFTMLIYRNSNVIDRYQNTELVIPPAVEIEASLSRAGQEIKLSRLPD